MHYQVERFGPNRPGRRCRADARRASFVDTTATQNIVALPGAGGEDAVWGRRAGCSVAYRCLPPPRWSVSCVCRKATKLLLRWNPLAEPKVLYVFGAEHAVDPSSTTRSHVSSIPSASRMPVRGQAVDGGQQSSPSAAVRGGGERPSSAARATTSCSTATAPPSGASGCGGAPLSPSRDRCRQRAASRAMQVDGAQVLYWNGDGSPAAFCANRRACGPLRGAALGGNRWSSMRRSRRCRRAAAEVGSGCRRRWRWAWHIWGWQRSGEGAAWCWVCLIGGPGRLGDWIGPRHSHRGCGARLPGVPA